MSHEHDDCQVRAHAFFSAGGFTRKRGCVAASVLGPCLFAPAIALAQSEEGSSVGGIDIHGFVSQGFLKTTDNDYLAESKRGSLEFSEVGLNFTKSLTDELRVGAQLYARDLGPVGNYRPQFDWYYLDYRFSDWLGIRAGRTKLPFGLYNEINDVDSARVPILLPQSVYPIDQRDYLLAQTGGEAYGRVKLGAAGALEYRVYGGTIFIPIPTSATPGISVGAIDVPYLYGGRLMWQPPIDGLQIGGSYQALRLNIDYRLTSEASTPLKTAGVLPADFNGKLPVELPVKLWVASAEYSAHDLLLAAEYGRWSADIETSAPALFPERHTVNERGYGMAAYRVTSWFSPGLYYSILYPNMDHRSGRERYQHDFAVTVRYDLTANWLVKLEGHVMHGTAALNRDLNDGRALNTLTTNWGLFVFKTTAYF
jgi:hypothetical protein